MDPPLRDSLTSWQRIALIAEQAVKWREMASQRRPVEPGSSLAAEDQIFPLMPPSYLIWHGISHAVDHLDTFTHTVVEAKVSFPLAPQTLARSGVLGAAHALWMLDGPNRVERQLRALRMAYEEFRNERVAYDEVAQGEDESSEMRRIVAVRDEWMARAVEAGVTIGKTPGEVVQRPRDTTLIDEVITRYEEVHRPEDGASLVGTYRLIWRMHSGVTHGFRWPVIHRTDFSNAVLGGKDDELGGLVTNDDDHLMVSATAMYLLIKRAFELYDLRRVRYAC